MEKIWKKRFESNDFAARFFQVQKISHEKKCISAENHLILTKNFSPVLFKIK